MGRQARYRATEIESLERALAERSREVKASAAAEDEHAALMELPEVKAKLREMMAAHYEDWVAQKIPALGGRTPLEAVKDADGREKVEALVRQMERDSKERALAVDADIISRVRERLGLS